MRCQLARLTPVREGTLTRSGGVVTLACGAKDSRRTDSPIVIRSLEGMTQPPRRAEARSALVRTGLITRTA